jgi:CO/xanthine dehydrogenase Mo-binding subunit
MAATDAPAAGRQSAIGASTPRRDSEPKVRGNTRFAADIPVTGLLHARLLLAHEAHAMIKSIDLTAARELPGVVAVLAADDLPIVATGSGRSKNPLAREEIMYAGHPVAIAVAETEALAADAIELIELELEQVEAVVDVEGAVRPTAPRARLHAPDEGDDGDLGDAHAAVAAGGVGDEEELSENVLGTARLANGDVDGAFAASEVVVRGRFHTPWVYQGYLEPQTATAWFDVEGELIVSTSTQAPFMTRDEVASLFGLSVDRVRVRCAPIGGGFGGKMMIPEPLVVSAALRCSRSSSAPIARGISRGFAPASGAIAARPTAWASSRSPRCSAPARTGGRPTT